MSFLRINGWRVLARDGTVSGDRVEWEPGVRARTGRPIRSRRAVLDDLDLEVPLLHESDADALAALLEGRGHHFPFDVDAHAESGLGPDTAAAGNWSIGYATPGLSGAGVLGAGYLTVTTSIVWDALLPASDWTVMYWRGAGTRSSAEHVIVRSDGMKFADGVRDDLLATTELTVDEDLGAVALSAGSYDDLVILPWIAPRSFCQDCYRWMVAGGLLFHAPLLDGSARDTLMNVAAPTLGGTVSVLRAGGKTGGCIIADAAAEVVTYAASAAVSMNGRAEFAVEALVYPLAAGTAGVVANHVTGGAGWDLDLQANTPTGRIGVRARARTGSGTAYLQTAPTDIVNSLVPLTWNHVVFSWDMTSGEVTMWINGDRVPRVAGSFADFAAAPANDAAASLRLGNDSTGAVPANARIGGVRFYGLEPTDEEVTERWAATLEGVTGAEPRPFSSLPRLVFDGAVVGYRPREVLGEVTEQQVMQAFF